MMNQTKMKKILDILEMEYPQAQTRLVYGSLFELLIAIVLSAQTTDEQVNTVTKRLFAKAATPEQMAILPLTEIEDLIKSVGLYHSKARNIQGLSQMIITEYQGALPEAFEELLKLPGVGRKTANVFTAVGLKRPGLGVDTHVIRMSMRLGLAWEKNATKIEHILKELIPQKRWGRSHHLLITHGRLVCKARKPECEQCKIAAYCAKVL